MKSLITKSFGFFKMTKFFDCKFSMISRLIATCQGKEFTKNCRSFMIVRMTGQSTICGDSEISDHKIRFIFKMYNTIKWYPSCEELKHYDWTRHNLWVQRILRLQNIFRFCYLQDDQTIYNLWGHHRYLETIMLHTFNRSRLLKNKRAFVKFIDCQKLLHRSLNRQVPLTFS